MPTEIGDAPPPEPTAAEKLAPWLRRGIMGGCLIYICCSFQLYEEDARSHTIAEVYPLLGDYTRITALQPGYDPRLAEWCAVREAVPVADGAVFFVKTERATYAVQITNQKLKPETADYACLKVGSTEPVTKGGMEAFPGGIRLDGQTIGWSGGTPGHGFIYVDAAFLRGKPPRYTIGVPFQSGALEQFRGAVPGGVHFESLPWKIAGDGAGIP